MAGKIIVIEGTDCSGKQTQSEKIVENLKNKGIKAIRFAFPNYQSPTGKIIGGPYLGKVAYGECFFPEGAGEVPPKVASLYYAADRLYNLPEINKYLNEEYIVVLDRYVESNMAYQAGKINDKKEKKEMYDFLENLEYGLLKLPRPDLKIFLFMPYESACVLKKHREEPADQHEKNETILKNAEKTYFEIAKLYDYKIINCTNGENIKTIKEIEKEVLKIVLEFLKK